MKEITLQIEGMMCTHCEAAVKKCLEAFPEVEEAAVSHEQGTAVLKLSGEPQLDSMKKALDELGYPVK